MILASITRTPDMTRDIFNTNVEVVTALSKSAAKVAPDALMCNIINHVNNLDVAIATAVLKKAVQFDLKRVIEICLYQHFYC